MTHEIGDSLPAQTPPAGFADRVVAAALRERRGRRESGDGARRGACQAALVAVAATLLVGGAAWGFSLWARPGSVGTVSTPMAAATVTALPRERPAVAASPVELDAGGERDAAVAARMPAQPVLHRLKSVKAAEAKSDAGTKVIVPPCECGRDEVICTCF
ncbi:MAG TPA: hypothetical protein VK841_12765 [Polyangiaceae bacterium]|nr:hypothetical protein [Polyangiaceae bacterium]